MAFLTWNKDFSVEVESLDKQHQKLFAMLNELHDAMSVGKGRQLVPAILKRLILYCCEHFSAEEALMQRANYPNFATHKAEHDKLKNEVAKMAKAFESGNASLQLSMQLQNFLRDWLQSHIRQCDKSYSAHLRTAGIN
jgi:hemerythrin